MSKESTDMKENENPGNEEKLNDIMREAQEFMKGKKKPEDEKSADEAPQEEPVKADEKKEPSPEEKVAALEAEIAELKEEQLYKAAENDNWRKRMMQQKDEAIAYANSSLLGDLLDSLDNLDRTVESASTAKEPKAIADGVAMVSKSLVGMLENKYGLVAYGAVGDVFDPDIHEAIGMQEGDVEQETLAAVYLKGYKLRDRVIRHAKVMVMKPKA